MTELEEATVQLNLNQQEVLISLEVTFCTLWLKPAAATVHQRLEHFHLLVLVWFVILVIV